jgi:uncharacterized protein YceH (UPF0502 family)
MTEQSPVPPSSAASAPGFDLDEVELRVLAVLIEKSFVTPDIYPLSLNALLGGCNQLTGREPVMSLSEDSVITTLDSLVERGLVSQRHQAGARVAKWEHQIRLRHSLTPPMQAILAGLMLRGAQTVGELRARCERMHAFASAAEVEEILTKLGDKYPPMVVQLPKAPGTKEARYAHLMCGEAAVAQHAPPADATRGGGVGELEEEVRRLRGEVETLRTEFESFRNQFK